MTLHGAGMTSDVGSEDSEWNRAMRLRASAYSTAFQLALSNRHSPSTSRQPVSIR